MYVWRQGKGSGFKSGHRGRWVGPGLVLGDDKGHRWISMNNQIIKAVPEQMKNVTEEEKVAALRVANIMKLSESNLQFPPSRGFIDITREGLPP